MLVETYLNRLSSNKALIREQGLQFLDGFASHTPALNPRLLPRAKELQHLLMVPEHTDIIVRLLLAIDGPLDRVPVVVNHENSRRETESDVRPDLLRRHLQRAVSHDQDHAPGVLDLARGDQRAQAGAYGEPNRGPEYLSDVAGVSRERGVGHAELGGSGLGEHDVVGLEEAADALPDVRLGDGSGFRIIEEWCLSSCQQCTLLFIAIGLPRLW